MISIEPLGVRVQSNVSAMPCGKLYSDVICSSVACAPVALVFGWGSDDYRDGAIYLDFCEFVTFDVIRFLTRNYLSPKSTTEETVCRFAMFPI